MIRMPASNSSTRTHDPALDEVGKGYSRPERCSLPAASDACGGLRVAPFAVVKESMEASGEVQEREGVIGVPAHGEGGDTP